MSPAHRRRRDRAHRAIQLLRQGVVYYREGSGALSLATSLPGGSSATSSPTSTPGTAPPGWPSCEAAGGSVNDFLTEESLLKGAPIIATNEALYAALEAALPDHVRQR